MTGGFQGLAGKIAAGARMFRSGINRSLTDRADWLLPLLGAAVMVGMIVVECLILGLGVADDGSLSRILLRNHLTYTAEDNQQETGAYTVRNYQQISWDPAINEGSSVGRADGISVHDGLIQLAVLLNNLFFSRRLFDQRVLTALYAMMAFPVYFLFFRCLCRRVDFPSEKIVLVLLAIFMLGDSTWLTYFGSMYPDPLWMLLILLVVSFLLMMQREKLHEDAFGIFGLILSGSMLLFSEISCLMIAVVLAFTGLAGLAERRERRRKSVHGIREDHRLESEKTLRAMGLDPVGDETEREERKPDQSIRMGSLALSVIMGVLAVVSCLTVASRFTDGSRINAMTLGVLAQSENPGSSLNFFGIPERYEILADTSAYDAYPTAEWGDEELRQDFLSACRPMRLLAYYMLHPQALLQQVGQGLQAAFVPRRSNVGQFPESMGLEPRAQMPLFTVWTNYKAGLAPGSTGFLILIVIIYLVMNRRAKGETPEASRLRRTGRRAFLVCLSFSVLTLGYLVLLAGPSEFSRYSLLTGYPLDLCSLLLICSVLHRLNILESAEKAR